MARIHFVIIFLLCLFVMAVAGPLDDQDDPILKLLSNSGVDVVWDGEYIWIGTTKGLSGSNDTAQTWHSYDSTNGLNKNEVAALEYSEGRLWVANSSSIVSQGQSIPVGEGFVYTEDQGDFFVVDSPHQSTGPGMICYDISVYDSVTFAACFYGGLIYKIEGEDEWFNLFSDSAAEADFVDSAFDDLNNRYFSVTVDGNYQDNDTVVVWAGTAEGINQYQFIDYPGKLASNSIHDISVSSAMVDEFNITWLATDRGLSKTTNAGASFKSYFGVDGLTADYVSAIEAYDDVVYTAGYDLDSGVSTGFAYTTDNGDSWEMEAPDIAVGSEVMIRDITWSGSILWAAADKGGLLADFGDGSGWQKVVLDETETSPDSSFNQIYSVGYFQFPYETEEGDGSDSLFVFAGCANGYWLLKLDYPYEEIRSATLMPIDDLTDAGRIVVDIDASEWIDGEENTIRELALATWASGGEGSNSILKSQDFGETYDVTFIGEATNQLLYTSSTIWAASDIGLYRYNRTNDNWVNVTLSDPNTEFEIDTIINAIAFYEDNPRFWVGSEYGIATNTNGLPSSWDIDTVNLDATVFDYNYRSFYGTAGNGLSGDFVIAIEVQYYDGERIIWAAANSTGVSGQSNAINVSFDNGETWDFPALGLSCWNFAFDDNVVYAATSAGLLRTADFGESWDTLSFYDSESGAEISSGTEFFGVGLADDVIWAVSDDGVTYSLDHGSQWSIERTYKAVSDEPGLMVYASPLPSSPYSTPGGTVKFHYVLNKSGNVTIKIYDFAMNLVATPVENEPRSAETQYDSDSWDMRNDNGRIVSAGPYYFKLESSAGEEEWGKILVIP